MHNWSEKFKAKYNADPEVLVRAPGRINIIGEHTDYNLGFVLPAAIDRYMYFACGENLDNVVEIIAGDLQASAQFAVDISQVEEGPSWLQYIQSVLVQLNLRGHLSKPFNCIFGGDIPQGGGMSSSAALCCGLIFSLNELNDWQLTRKQIAMIAQAAEHGVGIKCGIMDQYASLFGIKDQVMLLDCRSLETQHFCMNLGPYTLFLINSQQVHQFATENEYNNRRASCEQVAAILQKTSLRDVDLKLLEAHRDSIDAVAFARAKYVVEENQRVLCMVEALKSSNMESVGRLLREAQEGMKSGYQITTNEIDFLTDFVNNFPGALGARMMGGGFGGCTINIVKTEVLKQCIEQVVDAYKTQYGHTAEVYELHLEDGVNVIV